MGEEICCLNSLVSRLNKKMFFEKFDIHLFAMLFIA